MMSSRSLSIMFIRVLSSYSLYLGLLGFLGLARETLADSNVKNLVLTSCDKAKEVYFKLPEEEQLQLFDFFKRVLELKSAQLPSEPRDSYLLSMPPANSSPFGSKPVGEDYFRSISPTREVDAKVCVLKIAATRPKDAIELLPGLFELETNPLLSDDLKFFLRQSLLEIAHANIGNMSSNKIMGEVIGRLTEKNSWLFSALLLEFGQTLEPLLISLSSDKDDLRFNAAINAIELERDNQNIVAEILERNSSDLTQKRVERLLKLASNKNLTSPKLFRLILAKLSQPTEPQKIALLKILATSGESVLELMGKEVALEAYLSSILLNLPLSEIQDFVEMTCVAGRCDKVLSSILKTPSLVTGLEGKLLEIIALSESFSSELWTFAEGNWRNLKSPNRITALRSAAAFPGKKDQAVIYLNQAIKELSSSKKGVFENRTELVRSVASSMVRLSPISATSIPQNIGEEILGLTSDSSNLPSLAISSIKPSPISLIIKAVDSKSEATVDQALLAIEKSRPLDANLFIALLELTGEASPVVTTEANHISADRVLTSYEDSGLPLLEQLTKSKNDVIARKAAIRLLLRRNSNKTAKELLVSNFAKLSCGAKFEVVSLLKDGKLFKADQLKHCISELEGSSYLRNQLLNARSSFTDEDWKNLATLLPDTFIYSECLQGNFIISKEILASKIKQSLQATSTKDSQILIAECSSRIPELFQPEDRDMFILLLEDLIKNSATLDLKQLTAAIRFGSRSEIVETSFVNVLKEENLSDALGKMLVGADRIESLIINLDKFLLPGIDNFVCSSQLKSNELEKEILVNLTNRKEENTLALVQSLSCLNPNSTELKNQLLKLALTPVFEENKEIELDTNLKNILKDNHWSLNYLKKRFESLVRAG